jgi:hypothetical protein
MSARGQAGKQVAPQVPTLVHGAGRPTDSTREQPSTKWAVYRHAIEGGWGTTLRLCLILAVSLGGLGAVATAVVKIAAILLSSWH